MKKVFTSGLIVGLVVFIISYGGLFLAVRFLPELFIVYNNPLFSSNGRDILFYMHAFIISFALSWFWDRCKRSFHGHSVLRGVEFGLVYAVVALLPVMWITFSSLDITVFIVASWFFYGLFQALIAGMMLSKLNP